jgi:hypothetical protein
MEAAHGKQRHTHISREVFNEASCKRVIDEFHGEEDLSNQIRQAFGDAAITAVVGEGEDGFDEAGAWVVQEVREGDRGGVGEEVRLPERAWASDADAQLLREQRRKEPFGRAQAYARKR